MMLRDKFYLLVPDDKQAVGFDVRASYGRDETRETFVKLRTERPKLGIFAMRREQLEHFFYGNAIPEDSLPGLSKDKVN